MTRKENKMKGDNLMPYLKEALLKKRNELTTFINQLSEKIVIPEDLYKKRLRISKTGNRVRYYVSEEGDSKNERYLKKGEREMAGKIAHACYDKEFREVLQQQLGRVERLLNSYDENELIDLYSNCNPLRQELLTPYGFFQGSEMIYTFESRRKPLDTRYIDFLIDRFLV